jgi:hypothetical protein
LKLLKGKRLKPVLRAGYCRAVGWTLAVRLASRREPASKSGSIFIAVHASLGGSPFGGCKPAAFAVGKIDVWTARAFGSPSGTCALAIPDEMVLT